MTKEAHQADQALIFTLKADIDHLKEDYLLLKT